MGCDIHVVIETFEHPKWRATWNIIAPGEHLSRNYDLFGAMCKNVRRDFEFSIPVRGIPEDASETFKEYVNDYGGDGHSHSYISGKEFKDLLIKLEYEDKDLEEGWFDLKYMEDADRICFFFDN